MSCVRKKCEETLEKRLRKPQKPEKCFEKRSWTFGTLSLVAVCNDLVFIPSHTFSTDNARQKYVETVEL